METGNLLIFAALIILLLYILDKKNRRFWENKGIRQGNSVPILGNSWIAFLRKYDAVELTRKLYDPFVSHGLGGINFFQHPFLVVTDPDLLKQIMVKDAEYFVNRHDWTDGSDSLMSKNLITLKDDNWRKVRSVMTTVFTSAKMKDMFNFVKICAEQSVQHIWDKAMKERSNVYEIEMKDFFSRYGTDVIATTAFGLEVDSFKQPNNEFFQCGVIIKKSFQGLALLRVLFLTIFPNIAKKFKITLFGSELNTFINSMVKETIREREAKNIRRTDVIQILSDARKGKGPGEDGEYLKGKLPDLTDEDIAAQAMIFFFAGFETTATLLGFICHELAIHPEIQTKVQEEIDEVIEKENGVTYNGVVHHTQYLNMVVLETLRKWPPVLFSDRVASKQYTIPKTEKSPAVSLNRGEKVFIPIAGFHYDPQYFPNPGEFNPERFRNEKNTIKPFTFLGFGEGMRHCIGMRFALMEIKTVMVQILKSFTIVPIKRTPIPIKPSKKSGFLLTTDDGFWLGLQPRN